MSELIKPQADHELFLPPQDVCRTCGAPKAEHVGWSSGGPSHDFQEPAPEPRPERTASSHIQTEWTCTHCGADCDVWGVADVEWMECGECGKYSYLIFSVNEADRHNEPSPPTTTHSDAAATFAAHLTKFKRTHHALARLQQAEARALSDLLDAAEPAGHSIRTLAHLTGISKSSIGRTILARNSSPDPE